MKIKLLYVILFAILSFKVMAVTDVNGVFCGSEIRDADQKIVDQFNFDNPYFNLTLRAVPWITCQDKVINLVTKGESISFAYVESRIIKFLSENQYIVPVIIPSNQKIMYQPGILDTVTHSESIWGYPHAFSTKALFMNCDIFEKAELPCEGPTTWDELYSIGEIIKTKTGIAGIGLAGKDNDHTMHQFLNYLYSNGGQVIDFNTGKITLMSNQTVKALDFYAKLASISQQDPLKWGRSQLTELFNDKKIAMYINGPWGAGQHNGDLNIKTVRIPAGPDGFQSTILITDSVVVFSNTGHEDIASAVAAKLTSVDAQYSLDVGWGLTPVMKYPQISKEDGLYDTDYWRAFIDVIADGKPEPLFTDYKAFQAVMNSMIQKVILKEGLSEDLVLEASEKLKKYR